MAMRFVMVCLSRWKSRSPERDATPALHRRNVRRVSNCFGLYQPLFAPAGADRVAVDRLAAEVYRPNPPGVRDVLERIRVEHDEIGVFADLDRARRVEAD